MRFTNFTAACVFLILAVDLQAQNNPKSAVAASQPALADVQTLIDGKQYPAAIKLSSKMLGFRGAGSAGVSRFQLTMLKGDAQAGQKTIAAAVSTYKSASLETQDPHEQALSHWTGELLRTAGSSVYTPKMLGIGIQKRGPFNLMEADQRKQGFAALLEDSLSALDPKLKTASTSQSLVPIWPVLQQVMELAQLDEIANGSDEKTTAIASGLLDHSRNLLSNLLKEYWARLGDIDAHANATTFSQTQQSINGVLVAQSVTRKNGLSDTNTAELKDMITTCHKIHVATEQLMKFAKNVKEWESILSDSNRVSGRAGDVLNTDYGSVYSQQGTDSYNGFGVGTGIGSVGIPYQRGTGTIIRPTSRPIRTKPTTRP